MDITWAEERSQRLGMHIAAFHGPGYGGSDYYRFTLEFLADDAVAVAEALGYERFGVLGFSTAALRRRRRRCTPDRVTARWHLRWHGTVPPRWPKLARR
jgi:hypothetical protein